ncbi:Squalene epoxidase [Tulasnella sp. JGI-2019a]|nr:Squalene epoxidase [Tulasnella sp. JGI-2019a]
MSTSSVPASNTFDVIIVGAGIAGPALACALASLPSKSSPPLRIALLDRSLAEPNRIVGELLQPGGMNALRELGLEDCVENIDAISTFGYAVLYKGTTIHIPYPDKAEGRSFHHGRFVMSLRDRARTARGVQLIEATVSDVIEDAETGKVVGVKATRKDLGASPVASEFYADIVFMADGWSSKFRSQVLGASLREPKLKSHFVGFVLEDVTLPIPKHGTVVLIPGTGPLLLYQIGTHETRMLVDVQGGLPKDVPAYVKKSIIPFLPENLREPILDCMAKGKPKSMPNSFLPASLQGSKNHKAGAILIGDAWNMRHPLTGGGMTVALSDVVILRKLLEPLISEACETPSEAGATPSRPFADWERITPLLTDLHWERKGLASTVNILSVALYDLFGAEDENLNVLREGCIKYFERGGECITGPVSLLAGLAPRPLLLANHFFSVAFYSVYCLFTTPRLTTQPSEDDDAHSDSAVSKPSMHPPSVDEYPALLFRGIAAIYTAAIVFLPLVWTEIRWW